MQSVVLSQVPIPKGVRMLIRNQTLLNTQALPLPPFTHQVTVSGNIQTEPFLFKRITISTFACRVHTPSCFRSLLDPFLNQNISLASLQPCSFISCDTNLLVLNQNLITSQVTFFFQLTLTTICYLSIGDDYSKLTLFVYFKCYLDLKDEQLRRLYLHDD